MPILYETHATLKSLEATLLEQGATMNSADGGLAVSTWLERFKKPEAIEAGLEISSPLLSRQVDDNEKVPSQRFAFADLGSTSKSVTNSTLVDGEMPW